MKGTAAKIARMKKATITSAKYKSLQGKERRMKRLHCLTCDHPFATHLSQPPKEFQKLFGTSADFGCYHAPTGELKPRRIGTVSTTRICGCTAFVKGASKAIFIKPTGDCTSFEIE